ncbi:MAG: RsmB/NOP family class I SAM-dependent RNA methyltransferase [Myxococcales bacterium]|nr:RsmB/NOP family class I SAM-dependent RNA methyltransferase [Myxococcales bacterium]
MTIYTPNLPPDAQPRGPGQHRRLGRVLDRILDAYGQVQANTPADKALKNVFARSRDLGSKERAQVGDALFGILRGQRRLLDALQRAAKAERRDFDLLDTPVKHRMLVLAWMASEGATLEDLEAVDRYALKRLPKVFERIVQGKLPPLKKRAPIEHLAVDLSLPSWLAQRLVDAFGEEQTRELAAAMEHRAPVTLRVDPRKMSRDEALAKIQAEHEPEAKATLLSPWGITLPRSKDLSSWALFKDGVVDLQDEGSQLIALATGLAPGEAVLDACAGAGGKSLAMWSMGGGQAKLTALDPDKRKLAELKRRADRVDARISTEATELETLPEHLRARFDVVLVDAPCTGTGTLRRAPDLVWRLSEADLERDVARQKRLLTSALAAVKPGGRLIYATCSILREEDEDQARYLLENEPKVTPLPLSALWGEALSEKLAATHEARIGPGPQARGPDGFYVAAFRKSS